MKILMISVLFSVFCTAQNTKQSVGGESPKKLRDITYKCDSLSKVYKKNVVSYGTITRNGVTYHYIAYNDSSKELKKMKIPNPVK